MTLSQIFQDYQNDLSNVFETIQKLDEFRNKDIQKSGGVIYTPQYIADYMISNSGYTPENTILEPSVGHGVFIFKLIEYVEKTFHLNKEKLQNWFENKVYGWDIVDENIDDLKKLLHIYFYKKGIPNINTDHFICTDTLFQKDIFFDYTIGNPPYIRTKNIEPNYLLKLRNNFNSCLKGNIDIYYAFIEKCISISNKTILITPNSFIYNSSAQTLRDLLLPHIHKIIDFKNLLVFKNASTYTAISFIDKSNQTEIAYKNKIEQEFRYFPKEHINQTHWDFFKKELENGIPLKKFGDIKSEIATLKDKAFIIEDTEEHFFNQQAYFKKIFQGKTFYIEKGITINHYKATKNKHNKIIFPYNERFQIINEDQLKKDFPKCYSYLLFVKSELLSRDKGKVDKYESWYAYGRKQGLFEKDKKYYLLIPKMFQENTKCITIKNKENFVFSSGFSIGFDNLDTLNKIKRQIESNSFWSYLEHYGKPWAGNTPYYSFNIKILKNFLIIN